MGFVDIDNMMLVLHVFMFASHFLVVYHDCIICLSNYQCVLISWTNLDLVKFMFVSCDFALGSLLCVCSFADV